MNYAIGDVQGCYSSLQNLLEIIQFDPKDDKLWFAGDIINRGPQSLETLRFIKALGDRAITVLGNHDLHCLAVFYGAVEKKPYDTLDSILRAPDAEELCDWLRHQPLLHVDESYNAAMLHAGFYPLWDLEQAKSCAKEVEAALQGPQHLEFFHHMYGNEPSTWHDDLTGWDRLRFITNCFTRMRLCHTNGQLDLLHKGPPTQAESGYQPWFQLPYKHADNLHIIFGHWAALECRCDVPNIHPIDSGCVWGNKLTALRLEDWQRFSSP